MSSHSVKYSIRIDEAETNQIYRFESERYPIFNDSGKLYRMKIISGKLTQQEVVIENGMLVETGSPITYQQT